MLAVVVVVMLLLLEHLKLVLVLHLVLLLLLQPLVLRLCHGVVVAQRYPVHAEHQGSHAVRAVGAPVCVHVVRHAGRGVDHALRAAAVRPGRVDVTEATALLLLLLLLLLQ